MLFAIDHDLQNITVDNGCFKGVDKLTSVFNCMASTKIWYFLLTVETLKG